MKTCCIAVIGHVDHGKTALVRALTGIETDRLAEEKARGLSIVPGFAHREYAGGTLDFVDAPGHEDFIQAMVAATSGARAALVVISAVEGICAQTREHLNIAGLLGIKRAVIAVTKSDLLDPKALDARLHTLRAALSTTPFAHAPMMHCSALTGVGMDALHIALEDVLEHPSDGITPLQSYLPIDRVFSRPGLGTVVTGTLLGQDLAVEDVGVVQPLGHQTTIRGLQCRGITRDVIRVGERMAANLRGVGVAQIERGAVLCCGGSGAPTSLIDVHFDLLPEAVQALRHMKDVRVLFGTTNAVAQVRLFGAGRKASARAGFAQLRFSKPVVGFAGQRAVIRCLSPSETLGGAVFLDPQAGQVRSGDQHRVGVLQAVQSGNVEQIARTLCGAGLGVAKVSDVARLSRKSGDAACAILNGSFTRLDPGLIAMTQELDTCKIDMVQALAEFHAQHPLKRMAPPDVIHQKDRSQAMTAHVKAALLAAGDLRQQDGKVALAEHDPFALLSTDQHRRIAEIETAFRDAKLVPPALVDLLFSETDNALMELLLDQEALISLHNIALNQALVFHADTLRAAAETLSGTFPPPQSFRTGQARSALSTSRRIIVPVLEHFDTCGVTLRTDDSRQMAPRNAVPPCQSSC